MVSKLAGQFEKDLGPARESASRDETTKVFKALATDFEGVTEEMVSEWFRKHQINN